MGICLSHTTALEFGRSLARGPLARVLHTERRSLADIASPSPSNDTLAYFEARSPHVFSMPLHFLVPNAAARTRRKNTYCHIAPKDLPESSLVRIGNDAYACCPELCFVLMATLMTPVQLIELGHELCGTYRLSPQGPARCKDRALLTSVDKLKVFLDTCEGLPGVKKARRALRYITPNSASPMETILIMLLCLPFNLGGYALPVPFQNYRIDFPKRSRNLCSKQYYVCDLYWPEAKLAIEYDSDEGHTGSLNITVDASKRNELLHLGITVITVTRLHLKNPEHVDRIARLVAKRLGNRYRDAERGNPEKRRQLRRELLDFSHLTQGDWGAPLP